MNSASYRSVLIVKPGSLGDIVHALPAIPYIARSWPETKIAWVVDTRWQNLLANIPGIHDIVLFPRERFRSPKGWLRSIAWFRQLSRRRADLVFDLQGLMRSALMSKALHSSVIVGGNDAREGANWFYNLSAEVNPSAHAVDRYRSILAAAGVDTSAPPEFPLGDGTPTEQPLPKDFVLLHPYARGEGKSLTAQQIAAFADALAPVPVVVAGIGDPLENPGQNTFDLLNKTTLQQFLWLARHAAFVVSVDSGPAHIAAAVTNKLLSIHTWSDPRRVGPYNPSCHIWQGGEIRAQNLRPNAPILAARAFSDSEIAPICSWVLSQINPPATDSIP